MNFEVIKKNLEKKGYKVSLFNTAKEATEYIDGQLEGKTVGFGGSVTLDEMGLYEKLDTKDPPERGQGQRLSAGVHLH